MNNIDRQSLSSEKIALICLLILSFASVSWALDHRNWFVFDDFTNIKAAEAVDYSQLFTVTPNAAYNDRPIRTLLFKLLYESFGLETFGYYLVLVVSHLLNVYILYLILKKLFHKINNQYSTPLAILGAGTFGVFPTSHLCVGWISGVNDLYCATLVLLSLYCGLKSMEVGQESLFFKIAAILFYIIGLRLKEMTLPLPIVIYTLTILHSKSKGRYSFKTDSYIVIMILWMVYYAILLFSFDRSVTHPGSPYYQDFSPIILITNFIKYTSLYFNLSDSNFTFSTFGSQGMIGPIFLLIYLFVTLLFIIKFKDLDLLLVLAALAASLAAVLPMANIQHRLYIYMPSAMIGMCVATVVEKITHIQRKPKKLGYISFLILTFFYLSNYSIGITRLRNYWFSIASRDRIVVQQLLALEKPQANTVYYIEGASDGYNVFSYGPGNVLNVLFNDSSISTVLSTPSFQSDLTQPYRVLQLSGDTISVIK